MAEKKAETPKIEPLALRVNDACDALSVSRSHLYAMAARGEIKLLHIGGRTLIAMAEIRRLLKVEAA